MTNTQFPAPSQVLGRVAILEEVEKATTSVVLTFLRIWRKLPAPLILIKAKKNIRWSIIAATNARTKCPKVEIGSEPCERTISSERKNIGIGDKNTEAYFNEDIDNLKNDGSFRFTQNSNNEKIKIYKLDDIFKNEKISLKENIIIKLDLEGFDFLALKGLSETIQKSKVIIFIEISKMLLENSENFSNEFDLFIKNNRLNIYDLNLKSKNVNEIIVSLNASDKNKETIGDYIISNHKLL